MTFRIDGVRCYNGRWEFRIKGIKGAGVYGSLLTDDDGRGLYLLESEFALPPFKRSKLIPAKKFQVPADAAQEQASRLLAAALQQLGWGPEVDQRNRLREDAGSD